MGCLEPIERSGQITSHEFAVSGGDLTKKMAAWCYGLRPNAHITEDGPSSIYNLFMIETLFKTPTPERGKSECYVLVLTSRAASGGSVYAFMEEHGRWNEDLQRLLYTVHSINTDEQLTYQHARGLYEMSKQRLAQMGFVHSFGSDGLRKEPCSGQALQPESAVA